MGKHDLTQHIQDCFVYLSIVDKQFLLATKGVIRPEYFDSEITENLISICQRYFNQFGKPITNHIGDELSRYLNKRKVDPLIREDYLAYLRKIQQLHPPDSQYILKRVGDFVKRIEFQDAAIEFVKMVESERFDDARNFMYKTLRNDHMDYDTGLKYQEGAIPTYYSEQADEILKTGIPHIDDRLDTVFCRGDFICVMGPLKGTKSWCLNHMAKRAIMRGLNVLHLSHEITLAELERRYDMMIGALTRAHEPKDVEFITRSETGVITERAFYSVDSVYNLSRIQHFRKLVRKRGSQVILKKYPMGSCTIEEIERLLDYLEIYENFIPDVLINDYIDIMKLPKSTSQQRDQLNECYIQHKRICDERNILTFTCTQGRRDTIGKARLTKKDPSGDIRKGANVDMMIALGATEDMAQNNACSMWIVANRTGDDQFGCQIQQNLDIGQFCLASWPMSITDEDALDDDLVEGNEEGNDNNLQDPPPRRRGRGRRRERGR